MTAIRSVTDAISLFFYSVENLGEPGTHSPRVKSGTTEDLWVTRHPAQLDLTHMKYE